jgi:DNA-binding CsgD family transcriptional regulator
MFRLGPEDHARVGETLRALYSEKDATRFPVTLLAEIAGLIPCENLGYNDINARTNQVVMVIKPEVRRIFELGPVLEQHFHEHPQLTYYRGCSDRQVYQTSDFMSFRAFKQLGIYREVYRHIDADHQLTVLLSEPGQTSDIGIAINRKRCGFSERERAMLNLLRPHIIQARANALAFTAAERRVQALTESLGALRVGVMTLRPDGQVGWSTPLAVELLERYFPGSGRESSRLPEPLAGWWRHWLKCECSASEPSEMQAPFRLTIPGASLTVHGEASADGAHRLLLSEQADFSVREFGRRCGLTFREAEVLEWLSEGKTSPEIAGILCVSPRTVHKHAERIFRKLGVETRHAAMLRVMEWRRNGA